MNMIEWIQPYDTDADITLICRLTTADAIKAQKKAAAAKNYTYKNDEAALDDFITVHWATLVDGPPRYPNGQLNPDDEGELTVAISEEAGNVRIDFGKLVAWTAMPPDQALGLAALIIKHANRINGGSNG